MSLFDLVTDHLKDPRVSAIAMESELDPVQGAGAAVSPPTYARPNGDRSKDPLFAITESAFVPAPTETGWHHSIQRLGPEPRRAPRVVLNSVSACSGAAETPLYLHQSRLGVALPAIEISGDSLDEALLNAEFKAREAKKKPLSSLQKDQIRDALAVRVSTWELSHRTADSWLQYADDGSGRQLWADDASELRAVLLNISHERGELTYAYAPNAAIYGHWLSAGTARRHAIPRAYSCEINGFGVATLERGATKLDPTGGATSEGRNLNPAGRELRLADKGGKKPSEFGFGQVPVQVAPRAISCELILRQASISLNALNLFRYDDDAAGARALAAKRVYVLLALAGHLLAAENMFLRSGCDLITVDERWGWRRQGQRTPEPMDVPTIDDIAIALQQAVGAAEAVGLTFQPTRQVTFSPVQVGLVVDRVVKESDEVSKDSAEKATES